MEHGSLLETLFNFNTQILGTRRASSSSSPAPSVPPCTPRRWRGGRERGRQQPGAGRDAWEGCEGRRKIISVNPTALIFTLPEMQDN